MIAINELRGIIAKRSLSQAKLAGMLGIAPDTFYRKMDKGIFGSDEIERMIQILKIEDPVSVFFAQEVTLEDTAQADA